MLRPRSWWPDVLFLAACAALTLALAAGHFLALDEAVSDWMDAHRPTPLYWTARVLNYLGQGGQVLMPAAILLAALLAWRRRVVWPLLLFAAGFLVTYATIGPLKILFDRAAPRFTGGPDRVSLFNEYASGAKAMSYPSGHVAGALVWYTVITILLAALLNGALTDRAVLAIRVLPPLIVVGTTTYLSFHWITDSVAGLLLGLVLARTMARVRWESLTLPERLIHR